MRGPRGRTLRFERLKAGLRQSDVARYAGCSRARISQLERMRYVPSGWPDRFRQAVTAAGDISLNPATEGTNAASEGMPEAAMEAGRGAAHPTT